MNAPTHISIAGPRRRARAILVVAASACLMQAVGIGSASAQAPDQVPAFPHVTTASWINALPADLRASILWWADHEEGDLSDWAPSNCKYPGGGVFNTGEDAVTARATTSQAHSGRHAAEATITGAIRAGGGNRAVRLMRWTDRPWDKGGGPFPAAAYYSTWMFLPETYNSNKYPPWDPGDGGWWNVFQFKAEDQQGESQPMWALNIYHDDATRTMRFGLYSPVNQPAAVDQADPVPLPVGRWFHVEAFYRVDAAHDGEIAVWQDGRRILRATGVRTAMTPRNATAVWGLGNYTDHVVGPAGEGRSTIYFDDCLVSTRRISQTLPPSPAVKQDGFGNHNSNH